MPALDHLPGKRSAHLETVHCPWRKRFRKHRRIQDEGRQRARVKKPEPIVRQSASDQLVEKTKLDMGNLALMSFNTSVQTSSIEISNTSLMALNSASWSGVAASNT